MAKSTSNRWQKTRKFLNDVHLWLGMVGGIVIFMVCLSGTLYTFSSEIQEWLEPELYRTEAAAGAKRWSAEMLRAKVEAHTGGKATSMTIPEDAERLVTVGIRQKKGRPVSYQIDPYTGDIKGIAGKGKGSGFFFSMFKLHRWLLLDAAIGRPIVGIATILFALGCLTGLVIWIPQKVKNWKQGLKIKWSGNWKRTNHDLHNSLGFYSFVFLLIMALSGLSWSFAWYKDGLSQVLGAKVFGNRNAPAPEVQRTGAATLQPLDTLLLIANRGLPYKGNLRIGFPKEKSESWTFSKTKNGFFASAGADKVYIDPYSASVLKVERFSDKSLNVQIAQSMRAIHTGEIFSTFSKIIYFICCLIATSLPVTGVLIWWNKWSKKRKRKSNKKAGQPKPPKESKVATKEAEVVTV